MKTIRDLKLDGRRVFVRVDFNVPLDADGNITDDTRIRAVLTTLRHVLDMNGKLIIASHLGRPGGKVEPKFSLAPVAVRLSRLLETEVRMAPDCVGPEVREIVGQMKNRNVLLLENLRFHPEEQENDDAFARELSSLCDVYINDAFAVSHRVNASVVAIARHVAESGAGFLLTKELEYFEKAMSDPKRPFAAVIGGAKISSKLGALRNMLGHVDKVLIGGAMANTFIRAMGYSVGKSKWEPDLLDVANEIMAEAMEKGIRFYTPIDVVAAERIESDTKPFIAPIQEIPDDLMALDIGPATSLLYSEALDDAGTIIWNGPMGVFEVEPFSNGTMDMVKNLVRSNGLTIVGGGDTDVAVHKAGKMDRISYISTGGGAFLKLLEGKTLPGVGALSGVY